ncbi:beta-lactamase-like protein 4 [Haliotis rufescens]|uniref:beta-lactamase-like protein 4 n=1 Tax=Haliotis rufescens TaxID=6454 RepID=UPI00201E899D|nr:beta-lactamase-like protein 4 [Haliotis rufescens]
MLDTDVAVAGFLTDGTMQGVAVPGLVLFFLPTVLSTFGIEEKNSLDEFIRTVMKCRNVTGVSVALVKKRHIVYTAGYGVANVVTGARMTDQTLISMASISKSFTATLAADAVAKGLTDWETPIRKLLGPRFKLQNEFRTKRTSLKDLLSHRLGMPSYYGLSQAVLNLTIEQLAHRLQYFPVLYQFRSRYIYSNFLYVLAGLVLQRATGTMWGDAIVNNIFKPLGMESSRVVSQLSDTDIRDMAYSCTIVNNTCLHNEEQLLLPVIRQAQAAAGVFSTARDMAKWLQFHLRGGKNDKGYQILNRTALRETYRPQIVLERSGITRARFPVANLDFTYALGWMNGVYRGYKKLSHTGSFSGYRLMQTLLPEEGVGVWVAITSFAPSQQTIIRDIITMYSLDLMLGKNQWLGTATACMYPEPWGRAPVKEEITRAPRPAVNQDPDFINKTEYVGKYFHKAFGKFEIIIKNETLRFTFGLLLRGTLQPSTSRDVMYQQPEAPYNHLPRDVVHFGKPLYFLRHHNGSVAALKVPFLEPSIPPVFVKDDPEAVGFVEESMNIIAPREMTSGTTSTNTCFILIIVSSIYLF